MSAIYSIWYDLSSLMERTKICKPPTIYINWWDLLKLSAVSVYPVRGLKILFLRLLCSVLSHSISHVIPHRLHQLVASRQRLLSTCCCKQLGGDDALGILEEYYRFRTTAPIWRSNKYQEEKTSRRSLLNEANAATWIIARFGLVVAFNEDVRGPSQ